jgi:phosphohistidine swiveling domain-containing protein
MVKKISFLYSKINSKTKLLIGTKIATKVLCDGQLVEVDANKGVVRIIK